MMANSYNVIYGILFPSAWCILVCCSLLFTGMPSVLGDDIINPGSTDMSFKFGDSRKINVGQNVNNQGSGHDFITYGDCSNSRISTTVHGIGTGDTYLMYGYSSAPGARGPSSGNMGGKWPQNMYNLGTGDSYIQFGSCSSSSDSTLDISVYNRGTGDVKIMYPYYNPSKVTHKFKKVGTGKFYVRYAN